MRRWSLLAAAAVAPGFAAASGGAEAVMAAPVTIASGTAAPAHATGGGSRVPPAPGDGTHARVHPPRLVVLIVVDQLGWNVLDHDAPAFTGGLRRLLDGGTVYEEAVYDHARTTTGPGHATLATGVEPRRHGVVDNSWFEGTPSARRRVQVARDDSVSIVGMPGETGRSPHRLLREGLADWLLAASPGSRVVSVSRKPRAAIIPAGRGRAPLVYWLSFRGGRFVTSTWYRMSDPAWVTRFDRTEMPLYVADSVWRGAGRRPGGRSRSDRGPGPYAGEDPGRARPPRTWTGGPSGPPSESAERAPGGRQGRTGVGDHGRPVRAAPSPPA